MRGGSSLLRRTATAAAAVVLFTQTPHLPTDHAPSLATSLPLLSSLAYAADQASDDDEDDRILTTILDRSAQAKSWRQTLIELREMREAQYEQKRDDEASFIRNRGRNNGRSYNMASFGGASDGGGDAVSGQLRSMVETLIKGEKIVIPRRSLFATATSTATTTTAASDDKDGSDEPVQPLLCKTKNCLTSCADFEYYEEALRWYEGFGGIGGAGSSIMVSGAALEEKQQAVSNMLRRLDPDGDGVPCPGLPHTPVKSKYRMKKPAAETAAGARRKSRQPTTTTTTTTTTTIIGDDDSALTIPLEL